MKGWFDAFRTDGGPTLYHHSNRTAVAGDISTITILIIFLTVFIAFLLIFPGVRSQRFTTFTCVVLSIFTGIAITLGATGSEWQTGMVQINTYYRAFSADSLSADLGVHIGLNHVNVTLKALPESKHNGDIDFNERFQWIQPQQMRNEYRAALVKGLPYPILTVAEYLSTNSEGFLWGQKLRVAGYYTHIIIWTAFASWLLMNLLLINVPRYGAYMMVVTGALMVAACALYTCLKPSRPLAIRFEDAVLNMSLGWQFYLVLIAGIICMMVGVAAALVDLVYPHTFSTILEVDFGTPYDRHILIVESEESRKRRTIKIPKLEEPINAGIEATTKLIRRLSKRGKDDSSTDPRGGVDNVAFEMDPPKTPLHAKLNKRTDSKKSSKSFSFKRNSHHLEVPQGGFDSPSGAGKSALERTDSKMSTASSMSASSHPVPDGDHPSFQEQFRRIRQARRDSAQSTASSASSSFGASALSRAGSSRGSSHFLNVPVESCPSGGLHAPLEKRDSRTSNIIVFHTQDARGQLTRRQSTDPTPGSRRASCDPAPDV
ncbi:Dual oxidase maturation factor 1 [Amphibalanus amphitrite]|uniref:Dual oxidase maturation factor 1 n=1 Tax=Amphibalanus amphitrite TaxID=1232801 RepID=A0A6A4W6V8_AMPAM|nr:Dual oxidase maturation factor 1 [Amphibalanus amphitrite]